MSQATKSVITFQGRKEEKSSPKVYVVQCGKDYKIGYTTKRAYTRLDSMQAGNPAQMRLVLTINTPKPKEYEAILHRHYAHKKVRGEWFELDEQDLEDIKMSALLVWAGRQLNP